GGQAGARAAGRPVAAAAVPGDAVREVGRGRGGSAGLGASGPRSRQSGARTERSHGDARGAENGGSAGIRALRPSYDPGSGFDVECSAAARRPAVSRAAPLLVAATPRPNHRPTPSWSVIGATYWIRRTQARDEPVGLGRDRRCRAPARGGHRSRGPDLGPAGSPRRSHRRRDAWTTRQPASPTASLANGGPIELKPDRPLRSPCAVRLTVAAFGALFAAAASPAAAQQPMPQNPSPMVENTRAHERLTQRPLEGAVRTFAGPDGQPVEPLGPPNVPRTTPFDLVVHFHGPSWLVHQAVADLDAGMVSAAVHLGAGSAVYDRAFSDPAAFDSLLARIEREVSAVIGAPARSGTVILTAFSSGHGAVRAILRAPRHFETVRAILLLDGMHTSYIPERTVIAEGGVLDTTNLVPFAEFARAAMRGEKRLVVTHSEIFP